MAQKSFQNAVIKKCWIRGEIHIEKYSDSSANRSYSKAKLGDKLEKASVFIFSKCDDKEHPHNYIAGKDGENMRGINVN